MQKSLPQRFYDLKTKIGGNRERTYYDHIPGLSPEVPLCITKPNKEIRRIIGQLEFSLQLMEENPSFTSPISTALEILETAMEADGVLTNTACQNAEAALSPLQETAKEYEILLISHAHIDMNWMWGLQETVAATLSTFRTILALMKEYPQFTYSQSQASVYKIVEDYDPAMMDEIKARIKEGRWECTANAWVETDKNMPNTESLLRHISCTREYMRDTWGVSDLEVDFSPDTFGHNANVPEINSYGDVKYYYHCRGHETHHYLYRWKAPSGKEILAYCEPYWYNSEINAELGAGVVEFARMAAGLKTSMAVYGVGNHGGGPTRRDIELAIEMQNWPVYPKMKFGTLHEYFKKAEAVRDKLPIWDGEINFIFTGCYTTQSRIKMGNRKAEAALTAAESLHAVANLTTGYSYPAKNLTKAWRNVLFTHFHDIITGSNVQESREHAMALYADTMSITNTMRENAARAIAENIDTSMIKVDANIADTWSEGAGVGYGISNFSGVPNPETGRGKVRIYTVFNPLPHPRREVVELTLWDWVWDMSRLQVTDHTGCEIPFQMRDYGFQDYWAHKYFRVYVDVEVPALGYKTVVVSEKEMDKYPLFTKNDFPRADAPKGPTVLENEHLKAVFCQKTGALTSLIDKKTGLEQIKPDSGGGRLVNVSAENKGMSAWRIGRHLGHTPVTKTLSMEVDTGGQLRKTLTLVQRVESSEIKTTISLDKDATALAYSFDINWEEYSKLAGGGWDNKHGENIPLLIYHLPLANTPMAYQTDIPAGHIRRPGRHQDFCGLQYGAAVYENSRAVAIVTDCKYGYRGVDDSLSLTLINTANYPDPYPERGVHKINLWVAVGNSCPKALKTTADNFCYPMNYVSTSSHSGKLPPVNSLMQLDAKTSVFSSAGLAPDGSLYVRVYETCGKDDTVSLTLPFAPKSAVLVDLHGNENGKATISGNIVTFSVDANCIAGVKIM